MKFDFLTQTPLFQGMSETEAQTALECLDCEHKRYSKGAVIYRAGDRIEAMGLILAGSVNIENNDVWGNKSILDNIGPGQVFAEAYACIPGEPLMVSVVAAESAEILFLNTSRLCREGANSCPCYGRLIYNLLTVTAQKNLNLSRRIFHTSPKTIRKRLLSYLSFQAVRQGSCRFTIPFNRQQLADYLGVDRSALSHELSKMRREGLLTFEKNTFCLNQATNKPQPR